MSIAEESGFRFPKSTLVGYLVNDTVVVFDRVRENHRIRRELGLLETMNLSLNQQPMTGVGPILVTLVVVSLLMVWTMVRFSRAMVNRPLTPGGWLRHRGDGALAWAAAYLLLWLAIVAVYLWLTTATGVDPAGRNLWILLLVAGAWLGLNTVLIAFIRAITRANARAAPSRPARRLRGATVAEPPAPPPPLAPGATEPEAGPAPSWPRRLWSVLAVVRNVAIVLLLVAVAELIPPLKALESFLADRQRAFLVPLIAITALGFVLLMGGAIHMALTGGSPVDRRGAHRIRGRVLLDRPGPAVVRRSVYRTRGTTLGAQAHDEASFAEVKAAWRARAWRHSPRWRRIFAMAAGSALLVFGIFGIVFVLAPAGLKLLAGLAVGYALVRTVQGWARS